MLKGNALKGHIAGSLFLYKVVAIVQQKISITTIHETGIGHVAIPAALDAHIGLGKQGRSTGRPRKRSSHNCKTKERVGA